MLLCALLFLTTVQDSAVDRPFAVDPAATLRSATVVMPTRRPAYEHLDDVFELPPRLEAASVWLRSGDRFLRGIAGTGEESALVPAEAVAIVTDEARPVDFEPGSRPLEIHWDEVEEERTSIHPFLKPTVALAGPAVVDLPWSTSVGGMTTFLLGAMSGRVADAEGRPVLGLQVHYTRLRKSEPVSELIDVVTTGPDGKWEREAVNVRYCNWGSGSRWEPEPEPEPVTEHVALRDHPSHTWQAFPYLEGGTVFLGEPALLSVFVVNENGEPVDGSDLRLGPATVAAPGLLDLPGPVAPQPASVVRDLGGWEIGGLPRGVYRVYARAPGHVPAAAGIDLSSGHRELMLTLSRAEPFAVTVLDAEGEPAAGASTTLTLASGDVPVDGGVTDASGKLLIDRAPAAGPFLLRARHPALGTAESSWEAGPREVTLTLSGAAPPPRTTGTWGALYDRLFAE